MDKSVASGLEGYGLEHFHGSNLNFALVRDNIFMFIAIRNAVSNILVNNVTSSFEKCRLR